MLIFIEKKEMRLPNKEWESELRIALDKLQNTYKNLIQYIDNQPIHERRFTKHDIFVVELDDTIKRLEQTLKFLK